MSDPYRVLGVPQDADKPTIKKAYRKLAAQHHPDRGGDAEKFKEVAEAYSILSNDQKRQEYHVRQQNHGFGNFNFGGGFNPLEAFEDFFNVRPPKKRQVKKNTEDSDVQFNLRINLEQIKRGATHTINFTRNKICSHCNGTGGEEKTACGMCRGSGIKIIRPNAFFVQQATCPFCNGKGSTFIKPCKSCNTNGYIQVQDRVSIKIEEE
jgi:molecular chaperone DnaJ